MLIGITGKKYSGKDTAGSRLAREHGFTKYALADSLKKAIKEIFMLNDDQLWGYLKKAVDSRWGVTPRKLLQTIGTELFRSELIFQLPQLHKKISYESIWIHRFKLWYKKNQFYWRITDYTGVGKHVERDVVVTDVRYPEEARVIKELGGILIKIIRPNLKYKKDDHSSETEIDNIVADYTVINDNNIRDLEKKIDKIMKIYKLRQPR